jgi:tryptophan synthase alpha chain
MNPIDTLFGQLGTEGRKAFLPFLTAGDPDVPGTIELARAVARGGASLLELGFPYSDPIADGPVIQSSYNRALTGGIHLKDVFACARQIADLPEYAGGRIPLVAMVSFSLIHRQGPSAFLDRAQEAGFHGAIVPDLPVDESADLADLARVRDFKLIQLVTPTTPRERAREIASRSTGFLYCVSVTGITGAREQLPVALHEQLAWLRQQTSLPLCVGFGVSRPEHVRALRDIADGVIVGSALIRHLEQASSLAEATRVIEDWVRSLVEALQGEADRQGTAST